MAAIATNTLREAIRNRLLYVLLFFAVSLMCAGIFLSALAYVEGERVLQNVGLGATRIFSVVIAIFVGVNLIHRDVERRTVYTILSKPLTRTEFLLGKFAGLVLTIWL
ncbi:MAG: ABC transporter permease subunit, partial [Myxococcota bacterium]|nr:ABC transporter permease subunit [Myxococcota bacterium]